MLCAIDALPCSRIGGARHQYEEKWMMREINKAFIGFQQPLTSHGVATRRLGSEDDSYYSAAESIHADSLHDEGRCLIAKKSNKCSVNILIVFTFLKRTCR